MITLKHIVKNYYIGKNNVVHVLKDINLCFRNSEFVSILGPSGCGKTSLLNIIGGLDKCDSGEVIVKGVSTKNYTESDWDDYRNKKIGFVFQSYNIINHLNVVRNVEMPLILAGYKKSDCRKKALEVLEKIGLKEQSYKRPVQLSGGQLQRVALARALVSDPEIILADEPTGALDAEAGKQVMEILAEIAKDRLVIMVTHNNILAEDYSTRIIDLSGGVVSNDTKPYDPEEENEEVNQENETVIAGDELVSETEEQENLTAETQEKEEKVEEIVEETETPTDTKIKKPKKKRTKKPKLSFSMALELSGKTLLSKKIRTALTSFAGSIGIIGIVLVLAISTGVNGYIANLEEGSLSLYPISINQSSTSLMSIMEKLSFSNSERPEFPKGDDIYTNKILGNVITEFASLNKENDLPGFKTFLDNNFDNKLGYVEYEYGIPMHVYAKDPKKADSYMKTEPFMDVMDQALSHFPGSDTFKEMVKPYAEMMSAWDELTADTELLYNQYELIGDSKWPATKIYNDENGIPTAEVLIVADEKNQLNDYSLFMLGLKSEEDMLKAITGDPSFSNSQYKVKDILGTEYLVLGGYDYFIPNDETDTYKQISRSAQSASFVENNYSVKAKVVGVIRPRKGAAGKMIKGAIAYNPSLTEFLMDKAKTHPAVVKQQNAVYNEEKEFVKFTDILNNEENYSQTEYRERLSELGLADKTKPKNIFIYAHSFEAKEKIVEFIKDYNQNAKQNRHGTIKYVDTLSTMMSFVNTMSDTISKALLGFTSISLIVSSIMISVIIYTSVLERRKEVGILRSIGARKQDIATLFVSESGMLGLGSGLLGVFIGWILTLPINALLLANVGIPNLAIMKWWHPIVMVAISFTLSVVAGVIPSAIAANQDPAVALRTE